MLPFFCGSGRYTRSLDMTRNFPNRGHTHEFEEDLGKIWENFGKDFGIYFQKDFGKDFGRTTRKFGLKWT
jgi:hypothetical protein